MLYTNNVRNLRSAWALLLVVALCWPAAGVFAATPQHEPITLKLIALLKARPEIKAMLSESIKEAGKINPDRSTNPVASLDDYYDFVDKASQLIPQEILANPPNLIRDQILQSISYFYFLIDQPLAKLKGKQLFKPSIQYYPPFATWTREFANAWGQYLNTPESWTQTTYQQFYADPSFGLATGWYESPANWATFNQFFARFLSSPDQRPIADAGDPSVVVAPADSVPQGVWPIDAKSRIEVEGGLHVKLARFYSIAQLLGEDSPYKDAFANGVLTHTFLNVNDYHRYHFAVGGIVKDKRSIQQNVSLEVSWNKKTGRYDPIDSTGWQFSQTRGYVIVDTGRYGLVALIPMGMAQVSSVLFEDSVTQGSQHNKGEMLGNFLFGGSDFVMLFQSQAGFKITAPTDGIEYDHVLMGEAYGVMTGVAGK